MQNQVNKNIIVKGEAKDLYPIWADFENLPDFMEPIKEVKKTGDRTTHWVVEGPFGQNIEWDAETTTLEKNKRIAWNSIGGDIKTTGQVTFTELPNEQTQVSVTLQYVTDEKVSPVIASNLLDNPEDHLMKSLRSFKKYVEDGEAQ